jgi:hypothetical protein
MEAFNEEPVISTLEKTLNDVFSNIFSTDNGLKSLVKTSFTKDLKDDDDKETFTNEFMKKCQETINSVEFKAKAIKMLVGTYRNEFHTALRLRREANDKFYNIVSEHARGEFIDSENLIKLFPMSEMICTDNIYTDIGRYVMNSKIEHNDHVRTHIIGKKFETDDERFPKLGISFESSLMLSKRVHCIAKFSGIKGKDGRDVHVYITYAHCTPEKLESDPHIYKGYLWNMTGFVNNIGKIHFRLYSRVKNDEGENLPIRQYTMQFWSVTNLKRVAKTYKDDIQAAADIEGNLIKTF